MGKQLFAVHNTADKKHGNAPFGVKMISVPIIAVFKEKENGSEPEYRKMCSALSVDNIEKLV